MRAKVLWLTVLAVLLGVILAGSAAGAGSSRPLTGTAGLGTAATGSHGPAPQAPAPKVSPLAGFTLYDQYNNADPLASTSQNFEASLDQFDVEIADDFVVPAGQIWSISQVDVQGVYFNGPGPASSFNVAFYSNATNLPGSLVASRSGVAFTQATTNFAIPLATAVELPAGTYWMSVQANENFSPAGQWGWEDRTTQSNQGAAFHNPGNGFACGPNWARKTTCVAGSKPDNVFKLTGTISAPGGWAPDAPLPLDLYGGAAAEDGQYVYLAGGYSLSAGASQSTLYRFDPSTNAWVALAPLAGPTTMASAVYYPPTHKIYVFGGENVGTSTVSNLTQIYDIATNSWTTGAPMPAVRAFMASGYNAANGKIYLAGGYDTGSTTAQATTWEYDPASNTWATKAAMPHATGGAASGIANGHLIVAGGRDATSATINLVWDYNIAANTWTAKTSMPAGVNVPGSAAAAGKLWVFGAGNPFAPSSRAALPTGAGVSPRTAATASVYDPATDAWSAAPSLPSQRSFVAGVFAGGKLYALGGYNGSTTVKDVAAYTLPTPSGLTFAENFDGVSAPALPAGWTASQGTNVLGRPPWVTSNVAGTLAPAADSAPNSLFSEDPNNVLDNRITSPSLGIRTRYPIVTFRQNRNLENNFDGGVLEMSVDGGAFRDIIDAGGHFITGGYNNRISTSFASLIGGRHAWSGSTAGAFVTTTVALPESTAGHSVILRWRMVSDGSIGSGGWRIDSVQLLDGNPLTVAKAGNGSGTISSAPGGLACGSTCGYTYEIGSSVTLTAAPAAGSTFTGWSGAGCSGTGTCTVSMEAAKSVTASFALQSFALTVTKAGSGAGTVTSSPAGISCPGTCSAAYFYNTPVTLTVHPGGKSRFGGWTGDCAGTSTCVVSMTAAHAVTATFLPPLAPPACKVPKVLGKSLAKAKTAIKRAHCKVGKISHKASSAKKKGKVIGQTPRAGKKLKNGAKVNVTVGTGPKKKKK
jgi:hypothetical protein